MSPDGIARTSLLIAAAALMERALIGADSLEARIAELSLRRAGRTGRHLHWLATHASGRAVLRLAESALLPGLSRHYAWRKRGIARWVFQELERGATQLIVLGAGFDALACRVARSHAECVVIEIDRQASSTLKCAVVADIGAACPNLHHLAADLASESIVTTLSRCHAFDARRRTVVVAEGLLMYVPPWRVARTMQALAGSFRSSATLIGTAMARHADDRIGFERESRWVSTWLRRRGEPFLWGVDAAWLNSTMHAMHARIEEVADPASADEPDPCPGEWLFRAQLVPRSRGETIDPSEAGRAEASLIH